MPLEKGLVYEFGEFRLDRLSRQLFYGEQPVPLTSKCFDLLILLVQSQGEVMTKEHLIESLWPDTFVEEGNLTQNISVIRKALTVGPSGEQYIETVPRKGYRFSAPVRAAYGEAEEDVSIEAGRDPQAEKITHYSKVWRIVLAVFAIGVIGAVAWLFGARSRHRSSGVQSLTVRSLVVLPFANLTGDSSKEYFSDGLTEEIINSAAGVPGLRVVARTSAFQFKGAGQDVRKIGRELGADAVLEGSVRWDKNRLRVTAQLNTTADGYHLWSRTWDRALGDVFSVQEEIAGAVVDSLTNHGGPLPKRRRPTNNLEAYDLYLEGRFFREKVSGGSIEKAIERLQRAALLDPNFAAAYALLADCYVELGYTAQMPPRTAYPKAAQSARRALELDDTLSYAHSVMGFIHLYFDWDWASAEPELRRAMALDPDDANAYHSYSHYLVSAGRLPESLEMSKQALEVDPVDARLLWHRTWNQLMARNFSEAIAAGEKEALLHPGPQCCGAYLIWAYEVTREYQKAIATRQKFGIPRDAAQELQRALEKYGSRGYWQTLLNKDLKRQGYIGPYFRTRSYAQLKEVDEAFQWLNRGIEERDSWMVYLNVDPMLDPLRSDPRFAALVRKVGIPTK